MSTRASRHKFDLALKPRHSPFQNGATLLLICEIARDSELAMRLVFIWAQIRARTRNPVKTRIKQRARFSRLGQQCIVSEQRGRLFDGAVGGQQAALQCIGYQNGNATGHGTLSRYYIAFPICVNHLQASTVRLHVRPTKSRCNRINYPRASSTREKPTYRRDE